MKNTSTTWGAKRTATALAVAVMLAACGGNDTQAPQAQAARTKAGAAAQAQLPASAYVDTVQKIYIAYFGRPADTGGLANFTARLSQLNAPTDISALADAYLVNAEIKALIDGFSFSGESAALYPGDTRTFVTAIYQNLLNREPDTDGLNFWVGAIDSGVLGKSLASLRITAAALTNTTAQGRSDAVLIGIKGAVANNFTTVVTDTPGAYAGDDAAAQARTMLAGLSTNSSASSFQSVIAAVAADMKSGGQAAKPYPLLLSYIKFLSRGQSVDGMVSGTCSGFSTSMSGLPVASTFEGKPALAVKVAESISFTTNCTPNPYATSVVQYFDANFTPLGSETPGVDYAVFVNAPPALPVRVAVGDSGSYGVQTVYTNSSRQTPAGRSELSYVVEADAGSSKPASAIVNLKSLNYDTSNVLQFTRQSRYRIATDGVVTPLSVDVQYSGASSVHLLTKVQPSTLKVIETLTGTGAVAVAGKTVSVHYTGWLYDAGALNSHGAQIDSSVGKAPLDFTLGTGMVIAGFDLGVTGMKVGGKRTLIIPAKQAYGNGGGSIPAATGLVFDVELVSVK